MGYWLLFGYWLLVIGVLPGCIQSSNIEKTQEYIRQSESYYRQAIQEYKDLIVKGKDLDRLYLELGKVYFSRGDFAQAVEALKKSQDIQAKKFLAITYYRLGDFTAALEIFGRQALADEEYLYYYGLTCEKLNLFDQALGNYKKIKTKEFASLASGRINIIEKQSNLRQIQDVDPRVNEVILAAPAQEKYPQAGALILYCDEKIEVSPEDTMVSYLHYIVKILNERGKESFAEVQIDYDSTYEKVELEYARTIKPNGQVTEVGIRHIRDVSKYLNFPLYSNARVFIISFPEIAEGATIEYKVKIYRNQLINKKDFVLDYPLQASEPIMLANFTVDLPKEKTLHMKVLNNEYNNFGANLNPEIKEQGGRLIYRWEFKNIPQIIPESNMPPNIEINPTVLMSTFSSWQEIYGWWQPLALDKMKIDAAIKEAVNKLTQGLRSDEARVRAIYNFCAQKIRYVAVEYGQAGYEPHHAADIFKNKYGDCKDQAILLVTMLKEAGFPSWPVLISTKDYYDLNIDFPAVLFNHCIAAVAVKDKVIFLDPTASTCPFANLPAGDQARRVLMVKKDGYEIQDTPLFAAAHNLIKQSIVIEVNSDETITAQKSIFSHGIYDQAQRYWLLHTQPELIEQTLKEKIQDTSVGARLDSYNIKNLQDLNKPVILSYAFKGPEYFTVAGALRIMPQLASLDASLVAKEKRKYAIDFDILDSKELVFEIGIPDNFVVKYMPSDTTEDSPWIKFCARYTYKNNKVFFMQNTELKKRKISENEYPAFKEFFGSLVKKLKQRIIIEKVK